MARTWGVVFRMWLMLQLATVGLAQQSEPPASAQGQSGQSAQPSPTSAAAEEPQEQPRSLGLTPLSSALDFTPGYNGGTRSYVLPSFQWTGYGDSNPFGTVGKSSFETQSTYVGNVTVQRSSKGSQMNLGYAAGAFFYSNDLRQSFSNPPPGYGILQQLNLTETVKWRRWNLLVGDQMLLLPESPFGYAGFGGLASFGGGLGGGYLSSGPALNPSFLPNQSILTGRGRRLTNGAVGELDFEASRRSSFTVSGTYGLLHSLDPGLIDSNYISLTAGYNHILTSHDELALIYVHNFIRLDFDHAEILTRGFELAYGHKLTNRVSLKLSGGPLANQAAKPFGGATTHAFWATQDSLDFQLRNGNLDFTFLRFTTAGSGVLVGAETSQEAMSVGRQLGRNFRASFDIRHAYNQGVVPVGNSLGLFKTESWAPTLTFSREVGRNASFYLNYYPQRQISNIPLCYTNSCVRVFVRQVGGIGLNLHSRPIRLD